MGDNTRISYTSEELTKYRQSPLCYNTTVKAIIPKEIRKRRRGKRGGIRLKNRLRHNKPFAPVVTFGNCRSLYPKIDELRANCRFLHQYREASCIAFTETWLDSKITDSALEIPDFKLIRMDRNSDSGKSKGGGLALYVNDQWCNNIYPKKDHCCPNLKLRSVSLRPKYLPRDFTNIFITIVYIPPSANKDEAADLIKDNINDLADDKPEALQIILGDMNRCDLSLPGFHQHVTCTTRKDQTLDLFYSNIPSYKSIRGAPLNNSDHNMIYMRPHYTRKLKQAPPEEKPSPSTPQKHSRCYKPALTSQTGMSSLKI